METYALVTGASSGMGLHYALQLARRGYGIIIVSNRPDDNRKAADAVRLAAPAVDVRVIDADLVEELAAEKIHATVREWGLEVEVLVSNAGMLLFSTLVHTRAVDLERIVALHCMTPAKLIRLFGEEMKARGHGYILIVSSATAWMPYPTISHYGATKAFLKSFARSLWFEMRDCGVGVTAVFPGAVDTPLYSLSEGRRKLLLRLGIMQKPERTVALALSALFRRRFRCIPGAFTKLVVAICAVTPAAVLLPFLKLPQVQKILERA